MVVKKTSIASIHHLWCDRNVWRSTAISMINFIASFMVYGVNILADKYGRNRALRFGLILLLISSFISIFLTDFYINAFFFLMIWLSSDITLSLTFIYFMEFSSRNFFSDVKYVTSCTNIRDAFDIFGPKPAINNCSQSICNEILHFMGFLRR